MGKANMKNSVVQGLGSTFGAFISLALPTALMATLTPSSALAASYFVHDTAAEPNVSAADALIATNLVKSAVSERRNDRLAPLEYRAAYTLQPRLIKLGDRYLLTVEKMRGSETLFAAQAKIDNIDELDEAAKSATFEAIDEPSKPAVAGNDNSDESEVAAPYSNLQPVDYSNRGSNQAQRGNSHANAQARYGNNYYSKQTQPMNAANSVNRRDADSVSGTTSSASDVSNDSYPDHGSSVDTPAYHTSGETPAYHTSGETPAYHSSTDTPAANSQSYQPQQQFQSQQPAAQTAPAPAQPAARSTTHAVDVIPTGGKSDHWNVGFGPFMSHQLGSDHVMYDVVGGHSFDINSMVSLKGSVEGAFSSGSDKAHFFNIAAGGNYYFPGGGDTAPYLTGDLGYGFAQDAQSNTAEGFSTGIGGGVEFFRNQQTTLDLLLRYTLIFDNTSPQYGKPSILGARLAVNF